MAGAGGGAARRTSRWRRRAGAATGRGGAQRQHHRRPSSAASSSSLEARAAAAASGSCGARPGRGGRGGRRRGKGAPGLAAALAAAPDAAEAAATRPGPARPAQEEARGVSRLAPGAAATPLARRTPGDALPAPGTWPWEEGDPCGTYLALALAGRLDARKDAKPSDCYSQDASLSALSGEADGSRSQGASRAFRVGACVARRGGSPPQARERSRLSRLRAPARPNAARAPPPGNRRRGRLRRAGQRQHGAHRGEGARRGAAPPAPPWSRGAALGLRRAGGGGFLALRPGPRLGGGPGGRGVGARQRPHGRVARAVRGAACGAGPALDGAAGGPRGREQPRGRRKSKSRLTADRLICLTVEQKCDLAQRELEETKEDIQQMKENSERILQNYLAILEEADIRMVEVKRAMMEFDKDIVKTITKKKGSVIASDKVLRYMEDRIRSRDVMKEKIRLKNDSLKVQKKKMQMQLKQKEELGEALHEVDFQQLKIENAQFLEKIDERNQDLLQLKLTVGNTLQILNFYKKKLQYATALATHLVKDIAQRKESLDKIAREAILVEEEREMAEILNKKLRRQLAEYKVPPVLNYVHEKMAVYELENTLKIWERKVEIAEMALQSYLSVWHKAKMASHQLQALLPEQETHRGREGL
ncbi:cilia- and flagella-associated protein 263 isoform 1-T1 [Liasis olivaceus]